jgi:hypothetical protein
MPANCTGISVLPLDVLVSIFAKHQSKFTIDPLKVVVLDLSAMTYSDWSKLTHRVE